MKRKNRFNIDFFEFSFLVEACIPPRPIARMVFWHDVIDNYYHILTNEERNRLFEWITRNSSFQYSLEQGNEDVLEFYARYNPTTQYLVTTSLNDEITTHECFKYNNKYYTKRNTSLVEDYIIEIKQNIRTDDTKKN